MIKKLLLAFAILAGMTSAAAAATAAIATGNVNLRAGPSTAYPVVTVVPAGARITAYGCIDGYSWCDISLGAYRGWVSASYIQVTYHGAPVVLTPAVAPRIGLVVIAYDRAYWDRYYVRYPWYHAWRYHPPAIAPRLGSFDRTVRCADGACTATRSTSGIRGGLATHTRTCSGGECTAERQWTGPRGNSGSRVRNCSRADQSCSVVRTGPRGNTHTRLLQR
ncbi:SH3 domain-containing protein [Rhizobium terrae]|uniref:SH3 domain-containing protein n=1 Tax=Rhizobium terrae TaxID=2171756 RepID=UPI000E3C25B1|nr:SH3 domain-containing protein [Rhizobium terrae]